MKEPKYLIVGQGLAGSLLGCRMEEAGIPFRIVDDPTLSASSRIAGGIINPVVFKRLVLSDKVEELLKEADLFYSAWEKRLGEKFYKQIPIVKFFGEEQERDFWEKKSKGELRGFLNSEMPRNDYHPAVPSSFGYSGLRRSSHLNFPVLLNTLRKKWKKEGILEERSVNYAEFKSDRKVIFCEGYKAQTNPWFSKIGLLPAKGEILTVSIPGLNCTDILNKGVYIIPLGGDKYRVGATFSWDKLNDEPSSEGRKELLEKLSALVKLPIEVVEHKAGVRPAVRDRKPILGQHPQFPAMYIFNGLGTKGAMLGPYYSRQLCDFLEGKGEIDKEADVKRFF